VIVALLEAAIASHLEDTHTAIPGRVESVSGDRCSVKPLINRTLRDGRTEELPVVANVPIWFPRGGGASITWPVAAGDGCLLVFSERSLDAWKAGGQNPADPRKHDLTDAVAFVGLSASGGPSDVIELTMGGVTLSVSGSEVRVQGGPLIVENGMQSINGGGVNVSGGAVTHNGTNIGDDHVHPINGGSSAPGPTGGPH